jgi:hypothetical protein
VEGVHRRLLFDGRPRSIGEHIRRLRDEVLAAKTVLTGLGAWFEQAAG